jgi:hypothetical protein
MFSRGYRAYVDVGAGGDKGWDGTKAIFSAQINPQKEDKTFIHSKPSKNSYNFCLHFFRRISPGIKSGKLFRFSSTKTKQCSDIIPTPSLQVTGSPTQKRKADKMMNPN